MVKLARLDGLRQLADQVDEKQLTRPFIPPLESINEIYRPHLTNEARMQIFFGGASSGKSVFLAQRDVLDILKGGRNFLVCRAVGNTLRHSVFAEVRKVIDDWGLSNRFSIHKSEMTITCDNGYQFIFKGLDDNLKLKSITPQKGVVTDVRIEEATEAKREDVKQLLRRQRGGEDDTPKRLTMSFNPIVQSHWIFEDYFKPINWGDEQTEYAAEELTILKTWYVHNAYLTAEDIALLEGEEDEYYLAVYTFGNWGILGDVIFTNWKTADLRGELEQMTVIRAGLDFGFGSHPAAAVICHYDRKKKTIYIFRELYVYGLTNNELAAEVKPLLGDNAIVCDSAEPKSIRELQQRGIVATGAKKGKDSVTYGVQWLQQHKIVVDRACVQTANELRQYQWAKDRWGHTLRRPVDRNNHIIDALRYAFEFDMVGIDKPPSKNPLFN